MKRKIEWSLPPGPAGAKQAFDIMLNVKYITQPGAICVSGPEGTEYQAVIDYEKVEDLAADAMSVFPVNQIDFLDVDAGLHFTIQRAYRLRRTGDDR